MYRFYNSRMKFHPNGGVAAGSVESDAAQTETTETNCSGTGEEGDTASTEVSTPEEKEVTMTQEKLNRLLSQQFKKGARSAHPAATQQAETTPSESESKALALMEKAKDKLLAGTVRSLAAEKGLSAKAAGAAVKLCDFSDCFDGDDIAEADVADILEQFMQEYPEFKTAAATEAPDAKSAARRVSVPAQKGESGGFMDVLRKSAGLSDNKK